MNARSPWLLGILLVSVIAPVFAACGDSDAPATDAAIDGNDNDASSDSVIDTTPADTCDLTACGGNLSGTWSAVSPCAAPVAGTGLEGCETSTSTETQGLAGTFEFQTDDVLVLTAILVTTTLEVIVPAACIEVESCAALEEMLAEGVTCTGDVASQCVCVATTENEAPGVTGTWKVTGNQVAITVGNLSQTLDFCVVGDAMLLAGESAIAFERATP